MNFDPALFEYTVTPHPDHGWDIVLTKRGSQQVKRFFIAAAQDEAVRQSLCAHMDSLTNDLMDQWFNVREQKPKKEKKNAPIPPEHSPRGEAKDSQPVDVSVQEAG